MQSIVKMAFCVLSMLVLAYGVPQASIAISPIPPPTTEELITTFSKQYQVSEKQMLGVMACESGGNQNVVGDHGIAKGIYQYHQPTWDRFSEELGETLDINSSYDQVKLTAFAFSKGYQKSWTCYSKIYK